MVIERFSGEAFCRKLSAEIGRLRPAPVMAEKSAGGMIKETSTETNLRGKFNNAVAALKKKLQKKMGTRRGSGTSSVRG